jgi:hypothetical protein
MRTRGLKVKDEKFCELQMQVKNSAEGNEWGSDAYRRSECEQAAERDEYQPLMLWILTRQKSQDASSAHRECPSCKRREPFM